jgi:hypothetical protein
MKKIIRADVDRGGTRPSVLDRLRPRLVRSAAGLIAALAALLGPFALNTPPAAANASGCSAEYGFTVPYLGVFIPTTGVCVNVFGQGLTAQSFTGQFLVKACNFQLRLERWDRNGVRRQVNSGPFVTGCHTDVRNHTFGVTNAGLYDGGRACTALYMAGILVDRACVYTSR